MPKDLTCTLQQAFTPQEVCVASQGVFHAKMVSLEKAAESSIDLLWGLPNQQRHSPLET